MEWQAGEVEGVPQAETRACRNCGEVGHLARACTAPKKPDTRDCRICGEIGHIARNCPSKPEAPEGAAPEGERKPRRKTGSLAGKRCFNCGQNGHLSADCGVPAGNTACYGCGQQGHKSNECPNK